MKLHTFILTALFGLVLAIPAHALELDRKLAARLISEANQIRETEVTVGPIQAAERKVDPATTVVGAVCVTFIAPVIENGGRRRKAQTRIFFYDAEWGWYLFSIETIRGGDAIDLVSEHKGRVVLR